MKKQLIVAAMAALASTAAWTGESGASPKEEKIGLGSGVAIGAIAGGPIGAVIGAALGGWAGDRFHQERSQRLEAEERYELASAQADTLEGRLRTSDRELTAVRSVLEAAERDFHTALEEALEVEVYFRTEESGLDDITAQRLSQIAALLEDLEGFAVVVEGHADARGEVEFNDQLSEQRAAAVRDILLEGGVAAKRITMRAAGETQAIADEGDVDALALERRVNLTIVREGTQGIVARQ